MNRDWLLILLVTAGAQAAGEERPPMVWRFLKREIEPTPRSFHTATWDPVNQRLLVVGGAGVQGPVADLAWVLEPSPPAALQKKEK